MKLQLRAAAFTATLILALSPAFVRAAGTTVVQGTTNLSGMLAKAAVAYEAAHPGAHIAVTGTSSGAGIASLKAGQIDVAGSDVAVSDPQLRDTVVGKLGIAMLLGPNTGKTNLTRADVQAIYSGKVHNWKELGGHDQPIVVFTRPIGTGMRLVFEQKVAKTLVPAREPVAGKTVLPLVSSTPGAIGYIGFVFIPGPSPAIVRYNGVYPTPANIASGRYAISTDEHIYVRANATPQARAFVQFAAQQKSMLHAIGIF